MNPVVAIVMCAVIAAFGAIVSVAAALTARVERRAAQRFADNAKIAEGGATAAASRAARAVNPQRMPHHTRRTPAPRWLGGGEQR